MSGRASGTEIRITDVPFTTTPDPSAQIFINDAGKLRQTDLTTVAKYSELYELIIGAHNEALAAIAEQLETGQSDLSTQLEEGTTSVTELLEQSLQTLENTKESLTSALNELHTNISDSLDKQHTEDLESLTVLYTNSVSELEKLIEEGHEKLQKDISTVDDLVKFVNNFDVRTSTEQQLVDTYAGGLRLLELAGNSVQNGVPTPESPVAIESFTEGVEMINGYYDNTTGAYVESPYHVCSKEMIPCEMNETILCISADNTSYNWGVIFYDADKEFARVHTVDVNTGVWVRANEGEEYCLFYLYVDGTTTEITPESVGVIQYAGNGKRLAAIKTHDGNGNEKKEYIKLGSNPLRKVGDVADRIIKKDDVFVIEKNIASIVFDGSSDEIITKLDNSSAHTAFDLTVTTPIKGPSAHEHRIISDHFTSSASLWGDFDTAVLVGNSTTIRVVPPSSVTTVEEMVAWLQTNPTTFVYERKETIYEELPIETQEILTNLETFEGTTNIEVISNIPPSNVEVEYGTSKVGAYALKALLTSEYLKKSVADGKELLANTISGYGFSTVASDATFEEINTGVKNAVTSTKDAYYCPNGVEWTRLPQSVSDMLGTLCGVLYEKGLFLAYGSKGIFYSTDGLNWTDTGVVDNTGLTPAVLTIAYGGGLWVAGTNGKGILYSTDGMNWNISATTTEVYQVIKYAPNGTWFCIRTSNLVQFVGSVIVFSDIKKGITASISGATLTNVAMLTVVNNMVFLLGGSVSAGPGITYSTDGGYTFKKASIGTVATVNNVVYGDGVYAVGITTSAGVSGIVYSTDGISWHMSSGIPSTRVATDITYNDGLWLAIVSGEGIYISEDATTWRLCFKNTNSFFGIDYYAGVYIAVTNGRSGKAGLFWSEDGLNWGSGITPFGVYGQAGLNLRTQVTNGKGVRLLYTSAYQGSLAYSYVWKPV